MAENKNKNEKEKIAEASILAGLLLLLLLPIQKLEQVFTFVVVPNCPCGAVRFGRPYSVVFIVIKCVLNILVFSSLSIDA